MKMDEYQVLDKKADFFLKVDWRPSGQESPLLTVYRDRAVALQAGSQAKQRRPKNIPRVEFDEMYRWKYMWLYVPDVNESKSMTEKVNWS